MSRNNRALLVALVVLVLIALIGPSIGGAMMGPGGMMGGYGSQGNPLGTSGWGWGLAMGLGALSMLAFWGALIVGIILLVRWLGDMAAGRHHTEEDSALETLRRRYAAGEISQEEYEQRRKVLRG